MDKILKIIRSDGKMVMTKRGIYHDLNESEYATSNSEVALFFSSKLYLGKFLNEYRDYRIVFKERLARSMVINGVNTDLLADINLYKQIEKRGFRATEYVKGMGARKGSMTWQELQKFALTKMTEKSTLDWLEIHVQK